jgi:DNA-binding Lrp family transcriptional regulator
MNKTDKQVLQLLKESGPLALSEITEKLGIKPKAVFRSLRRLFENGEITSDQKTHRYALASK